MLRKVGNWLAILSFFALLVVVYDLGFDKTPGLERIIYSLYSIIFIAFFLLFALTILFGITQKQPFAKRIIDFVLVFLTFLLTESLVFKAGRFDYTQLAFGTLSGEGVLRLMLFLIAVVTISRSSIQIHRIQINPSLLFAGSFFLLIVVGTGLLLMPRSTVEGISMLDAFFTATSAVCVTGLIVVDTATAFTPLGQQFILLLIQLGGIGIMTFTSFFGFIFKGHPSLKTEIYLRDFISEERLGNIFKTLLKIIFFTVIIESIGAAIIFLQVPEDIFSSTSEKAMFAVFHSISAFCNAGFSSITDGLFHRGLRYSYNMHFSVAWLIVIGGLGFPIVLNHYRYLKSFFINTYRKVMRRGAPSYLPHLISTNTRIVVITTLALLAFGTVLILIIEYNGALAEAKGLDKLVAAFFAAVTPRTAGFNTVDMNSFSLPAVIFIVVLMWIGASPSSTGGGIKTSTFALAVINMYSLIRGKPRVEIHNREISDASIQRSFSIMFLSLVVIGSSTFLLAAFENGRHSLTEIVFECFSAYSTVGLTLGITPSLSDWGKIVIIFTMFIGRVGILTLLIGIVRKIRFGDYRYPEDNIMIN